MSLINVVSTEDLIGTFSGIHNLYVLGSQLAQIIQRNDGGVCHRLIQIIADDWYGIPEFLVCNGLGVILHAFLFAALLCQRNLAVLAVLKANTESLWHLAGLRARWCTEAHGNKPRQS